MLAESVGKEQRGTAFGTFYSIAPSLASIGPIVGGMISERYGFKPLFWIGSIFLLITAIIRAEFLEEDLRPASNVIIKNIPFLFVLRLIARNKKLRMLLAALSIYNFASGVTELLVPLFCKDVLKLKNSEIGFLYALLNIIIVFVGVPFGKLADKIGRRKTIIISWAGENLSMLAFIFSTNFYLAVVTFGFWAALERMDTPAVTAWVSDLSEKEYRATVMGIWRALSSVTPSQSALLGGVLYSISPYYPFFLDGVISLFALIALLFMTKED
jgi:MFS family permease